MLWPLSRYETRSGLETDKDHFKESKTSFGKMKDANYSDHQKSQKIMKNFKSLDLNSREMNK